MDMKEEYGYFTVFDTTKYADWELTSVFAGSVHGYISAKCLVHFYIYLHIIQVYSLSRTT